MSLIKKLIVSTILGTVSLFASDTISQKSPVSSLDWQPHHETSQTDNYDGIACAVMTLNKLKNDPNTPTELGHQTIFTQDNLFNSFIRSFITPKSAEKNGVAIEQFTQILNSYGLKTKVQYCHIITVEAFESMISTSLKNPNQVMIANYDESSLTGDNKIHYSIIAGLDPKNNQVLLINPDGNQSQKRMVNSQDLLNSMKTLDENHTPRGFIIAEMPQE